MVHRYWSELEMSLYREFPWLPYVPWESRGNGKYYCSSWEWERAWEWLDGNVRE